MKKLRKSRVKAILNDDSVKCFLFQGRIIKKIEPDQNVSIVVDVKGKRFEAGTKHLKEVTPCMHEVISVPNVCFRDKNRANECKRRFCINYKSSN